MYWIKYFKAISLKVCEKLSQNRKQKASKQKEKKIFFKQNNLS